MLASFLASSALAAAPTVTLRVVPAAKSVAPGAPLDVAVVARVPRGWHIYWENPGQSGLPTHARLTATAAGAPLAVTGPRWPVPARFEADGIVNYGYSGDTAFVFSVTTPPAGGDLALAATVDWLLCKESCIPGSGAATARVNVRPDAPASTDKALRAALAALPRPFAESGGTATVEGGRLVVRLPRRFDVFPSTALEAAGAPVVADDGRLLTFPLPSEPARLVLGEGQGKGFVLDVPAKEAP